MNTVKYLLLTTTVIALSAFGCGKKSDDGGGASDDVLLSDVPYQVSAGSCARVAGPYPLPAGTDTSFTVLDSDNTDYMDVGVIDDAYGCNFNAGYGVLFGINSVSGGSSNLADGYYDFFVRCDNSFYPCEFSVTWDASY